MKKIIIIVLFIYSYSFHSFSQIGLKGGINLSSLRTDADENKIRVGFQAGAFYDIHLSGNLYLQPQLLLAHEPNKVIYNSTVVEKPFKNEITTNGFLLDLPVLLSYRFPMKHNNKIALDFGGYLSSGLWGKMKEKRTLNGETNNISSDLFPNERSRLDVGLIAGVGYEFNKFIISGHLKYGLNTVSILEDKTIIGVFSIGYKL